MNRTQGKLEEARFFLGELERTYYDHIEQFEKLFPENYELPKCQYYLSAFISSARSVMWVMRSEYHSVEGWEEWYQSKKLTGNDEELLKKINDVRVRSEKLSPLSLAYNIAFNELFIENPPKDNNESNLDAHHKRFSLKIAPVPVEGEDISGKEQIIEFEVELSSFFWTIEDFPNEDILTVCKSYFSLLQTIVVECTGRFSPYTRDAG